MGKRGPAKEPVELKLVKGTRQPHRDPAPVAQQYGIPPNPFSDEHAPAEHAAYEVITAAMVKTGTHVVLTNADFGALEAAAIALCRARQASELVASLTPRQRWVDTRSNGKISHAYVREEKLAWREWRAFASDLGLSPSARANVSTARETGGRPETDDPLIGALLRVAPTPVD